MHASVKIKFYLKLPNITFLIVITLRVEHGLGILIEVGVHVQLDEKPRWKSRVNAANSGTKMVGRAEMRIQRLCQFGEATQDMLPPYLSRPGCR